MQTVRRNLSMMSRVVFHTRTFTYEHHSQKRTTARRRNGVWNENYIHYLYYIQYLHYLQYRQARDLVEKPWLSSIKDGGLVELTSETFENLTSAHSNCPKLHRLVEQ